MQSTSADVDMTKKGIYRIDHIATTLPDATSFNQNHQVEKLISKAK